MNWNRKCVTAVTLALALGASVPAYAAKATVDRAPAQTSYERERSDAEWASLRDNVITWEELQDLVHEYNPTVSALWLNYRQNDKSGTYDLDYDDVLSAIEDTYQNSIGSSDVGDAAAELTRSTALANVDTTIQNADRTVAELSNQKTEYSMTEAIRQQIISMYASELTKELNQRTADYDETLIDPARRKLEAGTGTELELLNAQKNAKDAQVSAQSAAAVALKARQTVLVNLGWAYDAEPEICAVPEVTDAMIAAIDRSSDLETALRKNYQLRIDERKLALCESDAARSTAEITVSNDKNQVQSDMTSRYNALLSAQSELQKAELQLQNQKTSEERTSRSYAAGSASARELEAAQYQTEAAEYTVKLDRYAVQSAYFAYLAGRDGLAGSSTS